MSPPKPGSTTRKREQTAVNTCDFQCKISGIAQSGKWMATRWTTGLQFPRSDFCHSARPDKLCGPPWCLSNGSWELLPRV